ncbi:hypothetical protein Syun_014810 [Stephania yunnanensis]|uniref:Uncharacterized protein n=1 Tax=Stephania yunnanensis TaxID=152371 RepID=A0AAP0JM73_9MAGN
MEGTPVLKRKHDDDYSTRRVESRFESSTKEAYTSRQKKCMVIPHMRRVSRRTQIGFNMAFDPCLESDWLPHVEAIINVIFDGNCGYRCIAFGLGFADVNGWRIVRIRMYDEIIGYEDLWAGSAWLEFRDCQECGAFSRDKQDGAFFKKWLTISDMRLLVSIAFNVILVNLSYGSVSTFLPLSSTPLVIAQQTYHCNDK